MSSAGADRASIDDSPTCSATPTTPSTSNAKKPIAELSSAPYDKSTAPTSVATKAPARRQSKAHLNSVTSESGEDVFDKLARRPCATHGKQQCNTGEHVTQDAKFRRAEFPRQGDLDQCRHNGGDQSLCGPKSAGSPVLAHQSR
jgi:hypothetical protein